jgi:hypothetical protein
VNCRAGEQAGVEFMPGVSDKNFYKENLKYFI